MEKKVTLDDISAATGFSKYSVSRALSGKTGVSKKTRDIIMDASMNMGYTRKTFSAKDENKYILILVPSIDAQDTSFWMKVIMGIESDLTARGYSLHLKVTDIEMLEAIEQELMRAAGVIFIGSRSLDLIGKISKISCPVLVLTYPPYNMFPYDSMHFADREGAYCLCEKMIQRGYRNIGFIGSTERPSKIKQYDGIKEAVSKYGVKFERLYDKSTNGDDLTQMIREMKNQGTLPSLIMCGTDLQAQSLIYTLSQLGLDIPGDVAVTGYNSDLEENPTIPITSMGFNKKECGRLAVYYLMERIAHPNLPVQRISVLPILYEGTTA